MKKLIVLFLFIVGLLIQVNAKEKECTVIKIGRNVTILNYEDSGNSNSWGDKVKINRTDTILPSDTEMKNMGIPDSEWFPFSEKVNGVYDSRVEKLQKKYEQLLGEKKVIDRKYERLLEKNKAANYKIEKLEDEAQTVYVDNDGALKYQLAKAEKDRDEIRTDYNKLFAENTKMIKYKNILEVVIPIFLLIIIFLGLKMAKTNFQKN